MVENVEITCSDGIFCNGIERWVNELCVSGIGILYFVHFFLNSKKAPCDDGHNCTVDVCNEKNDTCIHIPGDDCP